LPDFRRQRLGKLGIALHDSGDVRNVFETFAATAGRVAGGPHLALQDVRYVGYLKGYAKDVSGRSALDEVEIPRSGLDLQTKVGAGR
jgi:hypothetical protein